MRWSIRYQLLVPLLILLLGVISMSIWAALASAARARHQIETQMRVVVDTLDRSTFWPLAPKVLELLKRFSGAHYLVVDATGRRDTTLEAMPVELPPADAGDHGQALTLDSRVTVGGVAYLASGVHLREGPNAGATLYIFYPESLWRDTVWEAVRPSLVLGLFAAVAAVVLAVGVGQRLSRRVQELERRARQIAGGDFGPMPLPRRNDELRDLTRSVNEMAQRLAQYQETVRRSERLRLLGQVSGGLAHQLRNGVTGARLAVQLHARECNGYTDPEPLTVALRQLTLVEMHLKRFLDLGRASDLRREPCSLSAILEETMALLRPQCQHAHIDLRWEPCPAGNTRKLMVQGDAGQLGHLFLNVASNAVEAAGPGGWVEVRLASADDDRVVIEIRDSGSGPSAELGARLFEPFVTGKAEGVGLGLAVARQVAEAHGGRIGWRRETDQTCFAIELPLEKST
jgi:signal transduction histidine kinase